MKLVPFQTPFAAEVARIFHQAVHSVDPECYTRAQLQAWSRAPRSARHWAQRLGRSRAWLMLDETQRCEAGRPRCCGFINVETAYRSRGYIDSLYVHPDYQGQGIAGALYLELERWAISQGYARLSVDASIVSRPLFESQGFRVKHRSYQEKSGQVLGGFLMYKALNETDN